MFETRLAHILVIWAACGFTNAIRAQAPVGQSNVSAANAWMNTPTSYSAHDDFRVSTMTRAQRDQFWDNSGAAAQKPLTPETARAAAISLGSRGPNPPELPDAPNGAILIATFLGARSFLTASGRCVYTDITLRVDRIFESTNHTLLPNSNIALSIAGGTVKTPDGRVISYLTQPRDFFIQPFHQYLVDLSYHAAGDFFTKGPDWEVIDNVLHANDPYYIRLAKDGKSWIDGLTVDQFSRELPSTLARKIAKITR